MKEYITKKKITIMVLSIAAVLLAGGLWFYVGSMGNKEAMYIAEESREEDIITEEDIIINHLVKEEDMQEAEVQEETKPQETDTSEETATAITIPISTKPEGGQGRPSDNKPRTPEEATPPATESVPVDEHISTVTDNPDAVPESKAQAESSIPQSGDTNSNGAIYVPGFGWVESNGGENSQGTAPNAGTGEKIGDM